MLSLRCHFFPTYIAPFANMIPAGRQAAGSDHLSAIGRSHCARATPAHLRNDIEALNIRPPALF